MQDSILQDQPSPDQQGLVVWVRQAFQQKAYQAEFSDVEAMLDQVVIYNETTMAELRERLKTKETMIESLGKSLKEAKEKKAEMESCFEQNQVLMDQLRIQMEDDRKVAMSLEEKMENKYDQQN